MSDELLPERLRWYLDRLVPDRPPEMQAMEAYAHEHRFPIIGPAAGQMCYLITRMIGARRVFEMGSGYGYSTAWFARAVQENGGGTVYHVVWSDALSRRARGHLDTLGLGTVVEYRVGEAIEILHDTAGPFDLIFNDIEKQDYPASLPVIADRLRPGGVLIVDNALWHGRVFDSRDRSAATQGVREITRLLTTDDRWITSLAPVRDGLLIAYRR